MKKKAAAFFFFSQYAGLQVNMILSNFISMVVSTEMWLMGLPHSLPERFCQLPARDALAVPVSLKPATFAATYRTSLKTQIRPNRFCIIKTFLWL